MKTAPCETIRTQLSAYRDGALAGPAAREVEAHLQGCASCGSEMEEIDAVSRLVAGAALAASPGFDERLRTRRFERERAEDSWRRRGRMARRASLLAAALLISLLAGLGPAVIRDARPGPPSTADDANLNLVLFGTPDLDHTGDAP